MMRMITAVLLLTSLAGAAHAQPEIGSLIDRDRGRVGTVSSESRDAARQVLTTFGRCAARNRSQAASEILSFPLMGEQQVGRARDFIEREGGCLGDDVAQIRLQHLSIIGAMAEWFILNRYADVGISRLARFTEPSPADLTQLSRSSLEAIGTCVARSDPAAAFALVQTRPTTDQERTAIDRIVPLLPPCLPRGENSFNRSSLRAIVAAGLYRLLAVATTSGN